MSPGPHYQGNFENFDPEGLARTLQLHKSIATKSKGVYNSTLQPFLSKVDWNTFLKKVNALELDEETDRPYRNEEEMRERLGLSADVDLEVVFEMARDGIGFCNLPSIAFYEKLLGDLVDSGLLQYHTESFLNKI